jgi:DNA-binding GntR family transcriptional regulator
VLNLRILLETQLVRGAGVKVTGGDICELKVLASEFASAFEAGDNETARAANYRFHHRMFEIAAMPQTLHFVQILWARYPFDLINRLEGRVSRAAEEHDEVLAALIAGDAAAAMLATRHHIEAGFKELRDSVARQDETPQAESGSR